MKRILIIDDDADFAFLLQRAFRRSGILQIDWVKDGGAAVPFVNSLKGERHCNLIIADLHMLGMDGKQFLVWMQSHPQFHIPIIVLSGSRSPEDQELALELGARAFLEKPGFDELQPMADRIVRDWLGGSNRDERSRLAG